MFNKWCVMNVYPHKSLCKLCVINVFQPQVYRLWCATNVTALYSLIGFVQHKLFTIEKKIHCCFVIVCLRLMWSSNGGVNRTLQCEDDIDVLRYRRTTMIILCTSHSNMKTKTYNVCNEKFLSFIPACPKQKYRSVYEPSDLKICLI